ncbi:helix-turn-helix domain-containing protein [Lysinibacillus fusiformis]|uniref:helix-turn-helix domain-containing protein n=1 Tax=Lysinibacillus fusiformis TaxID=28031 RepID=UPI003D08613F
MALSQAIKDSIHAELTRQQISQRELARRLGVRQEYLWSRLSRSEKAVVEFRPDEIERIADALGVPVALFLAPAEERAA